MSTLDRTMELGYFKRGEKYHEARIISRYPEVKAVRIVLAKEEWIVKEDEILKAKPETQTEKESREYYEKILSQLRPLLSEPKTISELSKLGLHSWPIAIFSWLKHLEKIGKVKQCGDQWAMK